MSCLFIYYLKTIYLFILWFIRWLIFLSWGKEKEEREKKGLEKQKQKKNVL